MNTSEEPSGSVVSESKSVRILSLIALLLFAVEILLALVTYPFLPAIVPSHWNAEGQVNGYMSRLGFVMVFVGVSLAMYILPLGIRFAAKQGRDQRNVQTASIIILVVSIFMLFVELVAQLIITGVVLHW